MPNRRIILALLVASLWIAGVGDARAQQAHRQELSDVPETSLSEMLPDRGQNGELELPNRQIQQDAGSLFVTPSLGGRLEPKVGGLRVELPSNLLQSGLRYDAPLRRGARPPGAEFRLGRLYLDLLSLSTSMLYSDNINRTEFNRHDGFISIVTLDMLGVVQITDNLRLAFKAGLIWLPFENKFGVAGYTRDRFSGRLFYGTGLSHLAQVTYDLRLAGWDVQLFDHLRAHPPLLSEHFEVVGGTTFDEEDRAGRYVFRSNVNGANGGNVLVNETDRHFSEAFLQVANTAGVSVNRLLPTSTRLELGAYHSDIFYIGGNASQLPRTRDAAYVTLRSERETMRFQPFATYRVFRANEGPWDEEVRGGISGPVTENIQLLGSAGYFWDSVDDKQRFVGNARIHHTIGPYTVEQLEYRRDLTYPEADLENSYIYRLRQTLGPHLFGEAFLKYSTFEDLNNNNTGSEEWRTGVHLTASLSSRATLRFGGVYSRLNFANPAQGLVNKWTAVGQFRYRFAEPWETIFTYQYQNRNSTGSSDSYYENLFVFTLTYYFGQHGPGGDNANGQRDNPAAADEQR